MDELAPEKIREVLEQQLSAANEPDGEVKTALPRSKKPFSPDFKDCYLALFTFVLGFLFARWVLFSWQGWGVSVFTLLYCGAIAAYLLKKKVPIPAAGWFWLAMVILLGVSSGLWENRGLAPWQGLFLFGSAVYWILCSTGVLIMGKTSDLFCLDGINALFIIPFSNFGSQYNSLALLGRNKASRGRDILSILLGLGLALLVLIIVYPLLLAADGGGFARIAAGISAWFNFTGAALWETFWQLILAIPIAAYIFGLAAGSVHKRGTDKFPRDRTLKNIADWQLLPLISVYILLSLLCTLYIVFIGSQMPYFFSAFTGQRPEGWQIYSEYARSGFFELCSIAVINLIVLIVANVMSQRREKSRLFLKILNGLLAALTLVLIATAFSKMALYIGAYGLSMRRLLPCFFMIFMAVISAGVIARQKWQFSITRLAAGAGIIMFCTLCLMNPDGLVVRYNADRYLAGTLNDFDVTILRSSGPAGVAPALMVYEQTSDEGLKARLREYLLLEQDLVAEGAGKPRDNLEKARARDKLAGVSARLSPEQYLVKDY